ncbi:MAG: TonB-dependent receptor, partial [Gammaproteobacteria bacterium]
MTGFSRIACACIAGTICTVPAHANDPHTLEEILVSAPLAHSTADTALPVTILDSEALQRQAASTLGETLNRTPGVTSASFGNGVGQPVIRGQGGGRVSVLSNGIANSDASSISPDHANGTEPLLADRIEIIRGPATLLYGSGAIGGIVNVIDNRIPQTVPEHTRFALEQRHDTGNDGNTSVVRADGGAGSLAWHWDGVYRENNNTGIPGLAERYPDEPARSGVLDNSDARAWSSTGGVSGVFDGGYTGIAWSHLENDYGIPGHGHEGEAPVRIALEQDRFDWKGELSPEDSITRNLRANLAYTDYTHREYTGAVTGTTFTNETTEARVEWLHQPIGNWTGVVGAQALDRNFAAIGEEAFVPASDIRSAGLFWIEQWQHGIWTWEFGARFDDQHIDAEGYRERSHQAWSGSASTIIELTPAHSLTAAVSRSERAPAVEELFSDGVHEATASYEQGNPSLDTEV